MNAAPSWQWRGWRGGRAKDTMAMSHTPVAPSCPPSCAPVPPAPAPVQAEQPAPRVVWEDGGGTGSAPWVRLIALDWSDDVPPTYQVEVARGMSWWAPGDGVVWLPGQELDRTQMLFALAAEVDARQRAQQAQENGR